MARPARVYVPHTPEQAKDYMAERVELVQGHYEWMGKFRGSRPEAWDGTRWKNAASYYWQLTFGELPPELTTIRACENILCINPSHMLLLPRKLMITVKPLRSVCRRGHWKVKGTVCVPCRRKTWRDHNDRVRGKPMKSRWKGKKEWRADGT